MKQYKPLTTSSEWTFELIQEYTEHIERIAKEKYDLDLYPNSIEIIGSEQMLDAYSSHAMPIMYNHWTFGKSFVSNHNSYKKGYTGLAYEVVINSSPTIAYLMEENTMLTQILVIAHACVGHNYVYKNNYMFKEWTDAEAILDYLKFAKKYIADCEEKYGYEEVEKFLDACMTWQFYGVSKYKRPDDLSKKKQKERDKKRRQMMHEDAHEIWSTVPDLNKGRPDEMKKEKFPKHPEENILYFLEKNTPKIDEWKQEIIRIVRKIGQYFYPQLQAKVVHEGTATYWHYTIVNDLYEMGLIDDGFMVEFLALHTNVVNQPRGSAMMNPYALGFFILKDIERICTEPTDEDYEWFPDIAGNGKPIETIKWASTNFKDESFIQQFLSPNAIRHFKMFSVEDDSEKPYYLVNDIHDKNGYKAIRERLARQYNLSSMIPEIQIENVDAWGDRSITLTHTMYNGIYLDVKETVEALKHLRYIWGYDVILTTKDEQGTKHITYIISEDDIDIIDHMAEDEDDEEDQIALAFQGLYGGYIP